ncbi:MAG: dihydroorotase [Bacteroidales bacterium]
MNNYLIKNARIVNEGAITHGYVVVRHGIIQAVGVGEPGVESDYAIEIDANGQYLIPGVIDDQVHFREPGLTHKADIFSESKAAVSGGITSYMEMPNTNPQTTTIEALENKYILAEEKSFANYSFYLGATNNNINEIRKLDPKRNCGVKVFMGSSTGNMLVDNRNTLEKIFSDSPTLVATHCEDEAIIQENTAIFRDKYGEQVPVSAHPLIRTEEACFKSSSLAVKLAKKHNTRLHVLHISTEKELELFGKGDYLSNKKITAEVCIHHMWFNQDAYESKGPLVKWNPAVKKESDREALFQAMLNDRLDIVATDHAPHTIEEKQSRYFDSPSGGPMVQHALTAMLEFAHQGKMTVEKVVEKMCHAPAVLYNVKDRGFIRPGFKADVVLVDPEWEWTVSHKNTYYKCKWTPLEGQVFHSRVTHTFVNGQLVFKNGLFNEMIRGERLEFDR